MEVSAWLQDRNITQSLHYCRCQDLWWICKFLGTQMFVSTPLPAGETVLCSGKMEISLSFVGDKMALYDSTQTKLHPTHVDSGCLEFGCKTSSSENYDSTKGCQPTVGYTMPKTSKVDLPIKLHKDVWTQCSHTQPLLVTTQLVKANFILSTNSEDPQEHMENLTSRPRFQSQPRSAMSSY